MKQNTESTAARAIGMVANSDYWIDRIIAGKVSREAINSVVRIDFLDKACAWIVMFAFAIVYFKILYHYRYTLPLPFIGFVFALALTASYGLVATLRNVTRPMLETWQLRILEADALRQDEGRQNVKNAPSS